MTTEEEFNELDKRIAGLDDTSVTVSGELEKPLDLDLSAAVEGPGDYGDGEETETATPQPIDNTNEFALGGQLGVVRPVFTPAFHTKQQAWRFCAWVMTMAEALPDDPKQPYTYEDYLAAVRS